MPDTDPDRCAVCGWPLANQPEGGCVRGNCSERPRPKRLYDEPRAEQEAFVPDPRDVELVQLRAESSAKASRWPWPEGRVGSYGLVTHI